MINYHLLPITFLLMDQLINQPESIQLLAHSFLCQHVGVWVWWGCVVGASLAFPHFFWILFCLNCFRHRETSSSQPSSWENSFKECTRALWIFWPWCAGALAESSFYSLLNDNEFKQPIVSCNLKVFPAIVTEWTAQLVDCPCPFKAAQNIWPN